MTAVYVFMSSDFPLMSLLLVFTVTLLSTRKWTEAQKIFILINMMLNFSTKIGHRSFLLMLELLLKVLKKL